MLMDQTTNPRQMPTRRNMIDAMKWLVKDARPHGSLFFHCKEIFHRDCSWLQLVLYLDSGHGGQIPDTDGDEMSGFDEGGLNFLSVIKVVSLNVVILVIYPVDYKTAGVIIDDVSRDVLKSCLQ